MTKKCAVILSGCGHLDGAEIREAVFSLLSLETHKCEYEIFALNINQHHVVNHLTGQEVSETRNVLVEAARIARGNIKPLDELKHENFDILVIPGGFGAAKNYCNIAFKGGNAEIDGKIQNLIMTFYNFKKPIVAVCIAPAVVALALKGVTKTKISITLGDEMNKELAESLGANHITTKPGDHYVDIEHKIVTAAAYMRNSSMPEIMKEISKSIEEAVKL